MRSKCQLQARLSNCSPTVPCFYFEAVMGKPRGVISLWTSNAEFYCTITSVLSMSKVTHFTLFCLLSETLKNMFYRLRSARNLHRVTWNLNRSGDIWSPGAALKGWLHILKAGLRCLQGLASQTSAPTEMLGNQTVVGWICHILYLEIWWWERCGMCSMWRLWGRPLRTIAHII